MASWHRYTGAKKYSGFGGKFEGGLNGLTHTTQSIEASCKKFFEEFPGNLLFSIRYKCHFYVFECFEKGPPHYLLCNLGTINHNLY